MNSDDLFGLHPDGAICLSEDAYRQVRARLDLAVSDLGETELKNIAETIHVYSLEVGSPAQAKSAKAEGPALAGMAPPQSAPPNRPSIAVLPFDNKSSKTDETYFSDGITEDIITSLARLRSLSVIARNSSFAFRDKPLDLAEIGKKDRLPGP